MLNLFKCRNELIQENMLYNEWTLIYNPLINNNAIVIYLVIDYKIFLENISLIALLKNVFLLYRIFQFRYYFTMKHYEWLSNEKFLKYYIADNQKKQKQQVVKGNDSLSIKVACADYDCT